jgi:hypothetical protein
MRFACRPCRRVALPRTGAVDGDEQVELAFSCLHLGNIHVKEVDGIALEALPLRFVALDIGQTRDAVPLKAPMQGRARQMRDRRLQGVEAVVQRQKRMPPERNPIASSASSGSWSLGPSARSSDPPRSDVCATSPPSWG